MTATLDPPAKPRSIGAFSERQWAEIKLVEAAMERQIPHKFYDSMVLRVNGATGQIGWRMSRWPESRIQVADLDLIKTLLRESELRKINSQADRFNFGVMLPVWHDALFNLADLRVRNPGVPVHFLITGSNGSSKSEFAAMIIARVLHETRQRPVICLSSDEPISKQVQQPKLYEWLPRHYRNERGRMTTTARRKLGFSQASGFTENQLSLDSGSTCVFRFWSAAATLLEGARPWCVWWDEAMPLDFLEATDRRLLTEAETSKVHIDEWKRLLDARASDPTMLFPRDRIADLMAGVGLGTWTPVNGMTDVIARFQDSGTILRTMEADSDLLPRRDKDGNVVGGEIMPTLIRGRDDRYLTQFFHASDNVLGGNWENMKRVAIDQRASKTKIRWWCYGKAERSGGTPFSNFSIQTHVRPKSFIPKVGTYYMTIDPVTTGQKAWTMGIFKVAGEQHGYVGPGDIVMVHEYPQCDDLIPGVGYPDPWCQPGGKDGRGIAGAIQHAIPGGFEFKAAEIRRLWDKIGKWETELNGKPDGPILVPYGNLIMDSRAANTEKENESESKTLIEWMEDLGINCIPAGRGSGAQVGESYVAPGEQMINDRLAYDMDNAVLNEKNGFFEISPLKGRGPKLWILEHCTNTIMAIQNYPGINNGGRHSMFKDLIDVVRYLIIADPYHQKERQHGWSGGVRKLY